MDEWATNGKNNLHVRTAGTCMVDPFSEDEEDTHDAFALVGNEVRMAILRALGREQGTRGPPAVLPFAELRAEVGPEMDSSRFNYHLQQLVGHFVESVEDGYRLRPEGTTLYRTLQAGSFDEHFSVDPIEVGATCQFCPGEIEALYDDGRFTVRCPECEHFYYRATLPPTAVEGGIGPALLERCVQYERHLVVATTGGVCPTCVHGLDTTLLTADEVTLQGGTTDHIEVITHSSCSNCGFQHYLPVGWALLADPALITFFYQRGVDVTSRPAWELEFAATDRHTTIRSTDPWEVALSVSQSGDTLELVVDDSLDVIEQTVS